MSGPPESSIWLGFRVLASLHCAQTLQAGKQGPHAPWGGSRLSKESRGRGDGRFSPAGVRSRERGCQSRGEAGVWTHYVLQRDKAPW